MKLFRSGGTYKHRNFLDVVMHVTKVQYKCPRYWKMKVSWHLARNGAWLGLDRVELKIKDFDNWSRYDDKI
jgi:hypothetical protein